MVHETFDRIFLDHSGMIGYICDTQSYELLYMTQAAMQLYDMTDAEEYRGRPCYSILHGLEAPCPFCTNDKLNFEHEHRWSHYNEKLGRWLGSTDRLLMLDGRRCRLQVSKDITMRKEQDILSAAGNITMEDVLYRCIGILAEEDDTFTAMTRVLKAIGAYYQADRVCIFEAGADGRTVNRSFEWSRSGTAQAADPAQTMTFDTLSGWMTALESGETIFIRSVEDELDHSLNLYHILTERNVETLVISPLRRKGQLAGFLSVDNPRIKAGNEELLQSVSGFILEELQRRDLSEQLAFANTQTDIRQLLDFIRTRLDVDVAYVLEALTTGKGFLFTHMSVSDEKYDLVGIVQQLSEEDFRKSVSIYDEEGLCDYNLDSVDKKFDAGVLHYGVFQNRECSGSIGVIDYKRPGRNWLSGERAMIRRAGQALSGAIVSSRLEKVNTALGQTRQQLEETATALRQERQMYRDALLHDCDYAYIVNVNENRIEDVYKGGFLEQYSFRTDRPYDEAMAAVVEKMKPVILNGMQEFHLTSHYKKAYEQGKRMVEVEYYVPDTGAYKRKSLFLSKNESGVMHVFVVTHDITASRRRELEVERSLTQLADVAKEVGKGNLNVEIDRLNQQTVQDPLTGVKNKRAWQNAEKRLNGEISAGTAEFAIAVCDVNGLKERNDTMGHEAGDDLIIRASRQICNVFQHSPVFRIGGDEFAVILEGTDLADSEKLLAAFYAGTPERQEGKTSFTETDGQQPVSVALGFARYEGADMAVFDVFQRADEAMYLRKASMKAGAMKKATIKEERS